MSRGGERAPVVAAAVPVPVLAAVWCRSVGATWTVELHELDRGTALATIVDWISSGVPISEPEPAAALARELLTERGFSCSWIRPPALPVLIGAALAMRAATPI